MSIDERQSLLLIHEQRMTPPSEEQALKVSYQSDSFTSSGSNKGRGRGRGRGRRHDRWRNSRDNDQYTNDSAFKKSQIECYRCTSMVITNLSVL